MAADRKDYAIEETLGLMKAKADVSGDNFVLKIFRKRDMTPMPDCIATVGEAQVVHAANPEQWVNRLCGGGSFHITVFHMMDQTLPIGGILPFTLDGQKRAVNAAVLKDLNWPGPKLLLYPIPDPIAPTGPNFLSGGPSFPGSSTAPQTSVPGPMSGGPHLISDPRIAELQAQMQAQQNAFAAEREKLLNEVRQIEARRAEEKHQSEMRSVRDDNARQIAEIRAEMKTTAAATPVAKSNTAELVTAVATALSPIVTSILAGQQRAAEKSDQLLATLISRPAIDPGLAALIKGNEREPNEMLAHTVEGMAAMNKAAIELVKTAADIQMGNNPPEHPAMQAVREVAQGFKQIMMGANTQLKKKAQPRPMPQASQPHPGAAAQRMGNGVHPPNGSGHNGVAPSAVPNHAPPRAAAPQSGFAGAPMPTPAPEDRVWAHAGQRIEGPYVLDQLKAMIERHDPENDVALSFIYSINEEEMLAALNEVDGSISELIAQHLGEWAMSDPANAEYLSKLAKRVDKLGQESGLFEEDDGDEDDGDEGDDDDDGEIDAEIIDPPRQPPAA